SAAYDFLSDGGFETAQALEDAGRGTPDTLINETWRREDLAAALGTDGQSDVVPMALLGAHFDHNRALPADQNLLETEDPDRFRLLDRLFVGPAPDAAEARVVEGVRFQPLKGRTVVLLRLGEVDTRDDAETLRGLFVYAAQDDLPPLEEGEVYLHDLVGLAVWTVDEDGGPADVVGTVRDVLEGAAQLLFVVARDGAPDVLVPDVPAIVQEVDVAAGRILLDPPEGLFD
ncbi:MAG: ribosome maturation factor RimM, partial [Rubricoccaceae bacterium]|nr:ribosome maturation factor RimM [Rubricoccaceae bacterium]